MADRQSLRIDVASDVVCPWCYLGQRRLERAVAAVPEIHIEVNWRPFQLDSTIPADGLDRQEYMQRKFGDLSRLHEAHARLESLGADEGIDFAFDAIGRSPNTLDAHRVIRWAGSSGPEVQNRLVAELFSRYFERGENIGDHAVLAEAAAEAGMERAVVEGMLATNADRDAVSEEAATASRMGITGVPCFLFEGKYAVMGAQEVASLVDAIRQIAAAKARGEV